VNLFRRREPSLETVLGECRELLERCKSGAIPGSYLAFRELLKKLLLLTVLPENTQFPQLQQVSKEPGRPVALGAPGMPLRLNNGWYLELLYTICVEPSGSAGGELKLKTLSSSVQFQRTPDKRSFVFRYDYLRYARTHHPPGHVQISGTLLEDVCLPEGRLLEHIHFPTGRVTIEAIIRLLILQFGLEPNPRGRTIWHPVLHETETRFLEIARHQPSGTRGMGTNEGER
jgi:hypothetical protein